MGGRESRESLGLWAARSPVVLESGADDPRRGVVDTLCATSLPSRAFRAFHVAVPVSSRVFASRVRESFRVERAEQSRGVPASIGFEGL